MLTGAYQAVSIGQQCRADEGLTQRSKEPTARDVFAEINGKLRTPNCHASNK